MKCIKDRGNQERKFSLFIFCCLLAAQNCLAADGRYVRAEWGGWLDLDGDCQNTRQEILVRDSLVPVVFATRKKCRVVTGLWLCPYTGRIFTRAADIDIDHVVPLAYAFAHGGRSWSPAKKKAFANDPGNLLAVDERINRAKGSKGPEAWLPPRQGFWQTYLGIWQALVKRYGLSVKYYCTGVTESGFPGDLHTPALCISR